MSASVQWVATRATAAPTSRARARSSLTPMPGSSSTAMRARRTARARGGDELELVHEREAVGERGTAEAVAVADLDHRHARAVERRGDRAHLLDGQPVALGMAAVAQRGVDEGDGVHAAASSSPTRTAAEVMMSRLPA